MGLLGSPNVDRMKAKGDVKGLINALGYPKDARIRAAAAKVLGELRAMDAADPLLAALRDGDESVRQAAAHALGQLGNMRVAKSLIAALSDRKTRDGARTALAEIGTPAVDSLLDALKGQDANVRQVAAELLGKMGDARAAGPLVARLNDDSGFARQSAADALASLGSSSIAPLVAALRDEALRRPAASVLTRLGWQPDKSESGARYYIATRQWDKCAEIGTSAVKVLLDGMNDSGTCQAAAEALGKMGAAAVEPLRAALRDGGIRGHAAQVLDQIGWRPGGMDAAWYLVAKQDWNQCVALGATAVEPLTVAFRDSSGDEQGRIAQTLSKLGVTIVQPAAATQSDSNIVGSGTDTRQANPIRSSSVRTIVEIYSQNITNAKFHFAPKIPPDLLRNVIETYANAATGEEPLLLVDNTVFGSAKEGMLLTDKTLYSQVTMEYPVSISLSDIRSLDFRKGMLSHDIRVNGKPFVGIGSGGVDATTVQSLAEMLSKISDAVAVGNRDVLAKTSDAPEWANATVWGTWKTERENHLATHARMGQGVVWLIIITVVLSIIAIMNGIRDGLESFCIPAAMAAPLAIWLFSLTRSRSREISKLLAKLQNSPTVAEKCSAAYRLSVIDAKEAISPLQLLAADGEADPVLRSNAEKALEKLGIRKRN